MTRSVTRRKRSAKRSARVAVRQRVEGSLQRPRDPVQRAVDRFGRRRARIIGVSVGDASDETAIATLTVTANSWNILPTTRS